MTAPATNNSGVNLRALLEEMIERDASDLHFLGALGDAIAAMVAVDVLERQRAAVAHAAMRALDPRRIGAAEPVLQIRVEPVDVEIDATLERGRLRRHRLARLPLKLNRYCATRRICTSSVPSVMR